MGEVGGGSFLRIRADLPILTAGFNLLDVDPSDKLQCAAVVGVPVTFRTG